MSFEMRLAEREEIGERKGALNKEREMIEKMLRKSMTPEAIAELCDIPLERITEVKEAMENKAA